MKFGVMMHKNTQNIGDDIQTYAAARLLPEVSYFLDRENLDSFKTDDGKPAAVIMSAWYMWHKWNWPPSEYILPLFVGMHYTDNDIAKQDGSPVKTQFLQGLGGQYMNAYAPVGCRDSFTERTFKDLGIDAYFSGCITLTLPKQPIITPQREYICCTDVTEPIIKRARALTENTDIEIKTVKHYKDYRNSTASWAEREQAVKELLTVYQNAKCVITRRLHCALPCLAMGVPVLVINDIKEGADIRFEPYYEQLYNCSQQQFISGEYDYDITDPPKNPDSYLPLREDLLKKVAGFVEKYKDADISADELRLFSKEQIINWRHDTMKDCMNGWLYVTRGHINTNAKLEKKNASLKKKLDSSEKELSKTAAALKDTQKKLEAADTKKKELEKRLSESGSKNAELEKYIAKLSAELERLKRITSCRCVRYSVAARNVFVSKNKKIKL